MKRLSYLTLLVLLSGIASMAYAADSSDFLDVSYDADGDSNTDLPGLLYIPSSCSDTTDASLVIFLHGYGESGTNNTSQVNSNIDNLISASEENSFLVYAPQTDTGWDETDITWLMNVVAELAETYNIDTSRIYITGISMGGAGTWQTTSRYADVLAAEAPICGALDYCPYDELAAAENGDLAGEPIWTFHATNDTTVPVSQTRDMVNAILESEGEDTISFTSHTDTAYYSSGTVQYTEYSSGGHGIWNTVYDTDELYTWMLAQSTELHQLQESETVLFDIGNTETTTDSLGRTWNVTTEDSENSLHVTTAFAKMSDGSRCSISLSVVSGFTDASENGTTGSTTFDDSVSEDGWRTSDEGILCLTGLTAGETYEIVLFGSTTDSDSEITTFTINGQSIDLVTYENLDGSAIFEGVTADEDGYIYITVAAGEGSQYGYISALQVTATPEPASLAMLLLGGTAILRRRRQRIAS